MKTSVLKMKREADVKLRMVKAEKWTSLEGRSGLADRSKMAPKNQKMAWLAGAVIAGMMVIVIGASEAWAAKSQAVKAPPVAPTAAGTCVGCHGEGGQSANALWPNLAGQKRDYLAKQLRAFKDQGRMDPMMNAIAQSLSDADIEALALYYSSLKP